MSDHQSIKPTAKLLFLSVNDGSDTRINKEMVTLSPRFIIDFVGVAMDGGQPFFAGKARRIEFVRGQRRSMVTLVKLWWCVFKLRLQNRYDSVHVINENLQLWLLPLLVGQRVVLDVFDSIFLKSRMPRWLAWLGQRVCYTCATRVIVTDEERAGLMPAFVRSKLAVLPNFPFRYSGPRHPRDAAGVRILYAGSLEERRGTAFLRQLLSSEEDIHVVMAGWIRDEPSQALTEHEKVEWLGTLSQQAIIEQATRCDFILCHYDPVNLNNVYASPNKIYDAIQAGAGIIINPEVRISGFVRENHLGVVLDAFEPANIKTVARQLREFKAGYRPDAALAGKFLWESVEGILLESHGVPITGTTG